MVRAEPLRFSETGLKEIVRTVVLPYWNSLSFFTTYAIVDGFHPEANKARPVAESARTRSLHLSGLESLVHDVNREMEGYRLYNVVPRLTWFIDVLTNWYIRLSRRRFWKSDDDADKADAYATLYEVLVTFAKVMAPFMPFLSEYVYQHLVCNIDKSAPESVHFCDYPTARCRSHRRGARRAHGHRPIDRGAGSQAARRPEAQGASAALDAHGGESRSRASSRRPARRPRSSATSST